MNKYCFITPCISEIGGAELYILHKLHWLVKNNWEVIIITAKTTEENYKIDELERYHQNNLLTLNYAPIQCTRRVVMRTLDQIDAMLGEIGKEDRVILESHTGPLALWSELAAQRHGAKHVIALLGEDFCHPSYQKMLPFFRYKLDRRELFGGSYAIHHLFAGSKEIEEADIRPFLLNESPVEDTDDVRLNGIKKVDYSICYIGRTNKKYVPNIIQGVSGFAKKHSDKRIQFIIVGDATGIQKLIKDEFSGVDNCNVILLGDVFPLPKKMFQLVDVVVAGSGSARASAGEGVYTIVADPNNYQSNGVLGYDTQNTLMRESFVVQKSFQESLEDVLVRKKYDSLSSTYQSEPSPDACCEQNMQLIECSEQEPSYYGVTNMSWHGYTIAERIKTDLASYFPSLYKKALLFSHHD